MFKVIGLVIVLLMAAIWLFGPSPRPATPSTNSEALRQMESQTRIRNALQAQLKSNRSNIVSEIRSLIEEGKYADAANKAGRFAPAKDAEIDRLADEARVQARAQKESELLGKLAAAPKPDTETALLIYEGLLKLYPKSEEYLSRHSELKETLAQQSRATNASPLKNVGREAEEVTIRDYDVPFDKGATFSVMEIGRGAAGFTRIVTRRLSSSSVMYSERLFDCRSWTFKYLREGETREAMKGSASSPTMNPITGGSHEYYAALEACK